ncbi:hypothetical protein RHSIM_Rhsim09G0211700 [Rhododendron simsii]|uniref:60S ribosomal protein L13 n=1 Tax=Rhododendron simsii TaxID=118357 RepID=A0A834GIW3_RHOSS|nr:hypothetical protein RHSIM_Rhsim09G0211700 [Rhododendron simsii]
MVHRTLGPDIKLRSRLEQNRTEQNKRHGLQHLEAYLGLGPIRPVVHGQTLKYNKKLRAGRGFSLEAVGIPKKLAPTIGIAIDHPAGTDGDSAPEELATATQVQGPCMPIVCEKPSVELVKVTNKMKSFKAYDKLRVERMNKRQTGARMKKASEAEKVE